MKIIEHLLSTLDPEAAVKDLRQGPFWTAVHTRHCGLASTPHDPVHRHGDARVRDAGSLMARSALGLAQMALSESSHEAAIGMAAVNSLIDIDEQRCVELNAADLLAKRGEGKKVALVGHFPFADRLRRAVKELWVIERRPLPGDVSEDEAPIFVPQADVVGITGSAFVNHTIEGLLEMCGPKAFIVILGPTTPLSPVLFDYGVDVVSGTTVVEPESVLRQVSQGATFRQMTGVRLLTMQKDLGG
jgi:uncharacterized protein (DUF4213/DUF364 family)